MLLPVTGVTLFLLGALTLGAREVVAAGHRQGVTYRAPALARLDIVWLAASTLAVVLDGNAETEDGATGGKIAGPVAAQVIDAAVNQ